MAKLQNVLTALFVMGPAESWVTIPLFVLYLGPEVESMVSFSKRMMVLGILSGPSFLQEEKRKIVIIILAPSEKIVLLAGQLEPMASQDISYCYSKNTRYKLTVATAINWQSPVPVG